jgi:protein-S-isoprenylcysteine O-methyltransferase Ste14
MDKARAAAGSVVFFIVAPGTVLGLLPWRLTGWDVREPLPHWWLLRALGVVLVVAGVAVVVHAFVRFVIEGIGTPAPVAPPDHLVVGGLYRYVRNPMYVALLVATVGEALVLGQLVLLAYAAVLAAVFAAFVHWYEEPTLRRRFGDEYEQYRRAVPGWWPGLRR